MLFKSDLIWISEGKFNQQRANNFKRILRQSGRSAIISAQLMGYCPFSIDSTNRMIFSWSSVPFFMTVCNVAIVIVWSCYYFTNEAKINNIFPCRLETDKISYQAVAFGIYFQQYLRISAVWYRNEIIAFWENLQLSCMQIYEAGSETSKATFEQQLIHKSYKMNIVVGITCVIGFLYSGGLVLAGLSEILLYFETSEAIIFVVAGLILWNGYGILFILKALWFVHLIDVLVICFSTLKSSKSSKHERRNMFIQQYKFLEHLVGLFNSTFSVELTLSMISLGSYFINALYSTCVAFHKELQGPGQLLSSSAGVLLHGSAIFLICSSSTQLTKQVQFVQSSCIRISMIVVIYVVLPRNY